DAAARHYAAATQPATAGATTQPTLSQAHAWRQLIAFHLRRGEYQQAARTADEAASVFPDSSAIRQLRLSASTLAELSKRNAALTPMLATLAGSPEDFAVVEFLSAAAGDSATTAASDALLARLREVANRYPRSLAVQSALIQWYAAMKRYDEAAQVATRAM